MTRSDCHSEVCKANYVLTPLSAILTHQGLIFSFCLIIFQHYFKAFHYFQSRRKKDRLTMLYKIRHGEVDMDTGDILRLNDRRTRGQQRLYQPTAAVGAYKNSFYPRTIQDWNRLPAQVTDSKSIEEFRVGLSLHQPTPRS